MTIKATFGLLLLRTYLFMVVAVIAFKCTPKPSNDSCCVFTPLTRDDLVTHDGKGILQVDGSTSAYYYIVTESGDQLRYEHLNTPMALEPGQYRVKVNNSLHNMTVREGYLAKCLSGTLLISGQTTDKYVVIDSTGQAVAKEKLGRSVSLFPGVYKTKINETEVLVSVKANEMVEVRTGSLVAQGRTEEYYYVLDGAGRQLNFNQLGKPLAFMPGTFEVKVNNTSMKAEVVAGRQTALETGTVLVSGLTDEFYYVADTLGHALNFQALNNALTLFPGKYSILLNNTRIRSEVIAGQITELTTGCLTFSGAGNEYYYVFDNAGKPLNHNLLNRWLSFFPSDYIVKLGETTRQATIIAGQHTSVGASQ